MRSFILPVCALTLLAMVYTAPIQNDADDCDVVGNCVDEAVAHELSARSSENLFYGFPHNNNNNVFYPNNIGGPGIVLVTETAVAAPTVTEVVMTTVRPQSLPTPDSSGTHGGLLNGLVDILTGSDSHHGLAVPGALVPGLPLQSGASEVPGKVLPDVQQLTGAGSSEDNGITIKLSL